MFFRTKKQPNRMPINMATMPGYVVAAQLSSDPSKTSKPKLIQVSVIPSIAPANEQFNQMARHLSLNRASIRILLEPTEYEFLSTPTSSVSLEESKTTVHLQIEDATQFSVEKTTFDVTSPEDCRARILSGFVVTVANELISQRMKLFNNCKSKVAVIDIQEMAQLNMADQLEKPGQATVVLSVTPSGCLLTASRVDKLYFARSFDLSTRTLASSKLVRRDQFDCLTLEVQQSISMLAQRFSFLSLSALWLSPFFFRDELRNLLSDNLPIPVKAINFSDVFDCHDCLLPERLDYQAALFHVLGLSLREVGFLP